MDNNKSKFTTYIVLFCVVITFIASFFLGTHFGAKRAVDTPKSEEKNNDPFASVNIEDFDLFTSIALFNFTQSKDNDLIHYLSNLTNSEKLYIAGIFDSGDKKFSSLENKLIKIYGTNLDLKREDYYVNEENEPLFKYDASTDEFIYNENSSTSEGITTLKNDYVYNYKLDDRYPRDDKYIVVYYGLFAFQSEDGPTNVTNLKNIERLLSYESLYDGKTDEEYFDEQFKTNKNDFFKLIYTFELKDNIPVLVDFKQA